MVSEKIKVSILSDHSLFRHGLRMILHKRERFFVIQDFPCDYTKVDLVRKAAPNIVLYDSHSSSSRVLNSIMILEQIMHFAKVVVIASKLSKPMLQGIKVDACHSIEDGIVNLKRIMHSVASDKRLQTGTTSEYTFFGMTARSCLTKRELEVVKCVVMGKTSKEIAFELDISVKTVEVHRHNILSKLGISKTSKLVNSITESTSFLSHPD